MKKGIPSHAFRYPLSVQPADIDALGHVNNTIYLRWVQEAAEAHWLSIAPPHLQREYLWVVLRHEIDYLKPAFEGDQLAAYTWVGETAGVRSRRHVHICRESDQSLLATVITTWCLLSAQLQRPRIIGEDLQTLWQPPGNSYL